MGRAIAAALTAQPAARANPAPSFDISGTWDVRVSFLHGDRAHQMQLRQQDGSVSGSQSSFQFDGPVSGSIEADRVRLTFQGRYEGATIFYQLDGAVADGHISGSVTLGSASDHHKGPINMAQFGSGQFEAVRAGGA